MRFSITCVLALVSVATAQSVDSYISSEQPIAKAGLFANIGPSGSKAHGAKVRLSFFMICYDVEADDAFRTTGWPRCRQSKHRKPELSVHLAARLFPRVQVHHRSVHLRSGHLCQAPHRRLPVSRGPDPTNFEP